MCFTVVQRIINDERGLAIWNSISFKNTMHITSVFNAFSTRI